MVETHRFRKRPVVIEAWRVADLNAAAQNDWKALPKPVADAYETGGWVFGVLVVGGGRGIFVPTLEGPLFAAPDDWIIRGVQGEFYPIKADIFAATYEAEDAAKPKVCAVPSAEDEQAVAELADLARGRFLDGPDGGGEWGEEGQMDGYRAEVRVILRRLREEDGK